jgi:CRP-like cAMP-binding protein
VTVDFVKKVIPKSVEVTKMMRSSLANHFLFSALSDMEMHDVINAMERIDVREGTDVISEGDKGTDFYLIAAGEYVVTVKGKEVHRYSDKGLFGELALLHKKKRAATVKLVSSSGVLYKLDGDTFRYTLAHSSNTHRVESRGSLARVPLLDDLEDHQLDRIAEAVQFHVYKKGDLIIQKGDIGNTFYFIKEGTVVCTGIDKEGTEIEYREGDYFGEMALLLNEPRAANVEARSAKVTLLALDRSHFESLLGGPLKKTLDYNLGLRVIMSVPLFTKLSKKEKEKLVNELTEKVFPKGSVIIKQGDVGQEFYIVKSGDVEVTVNGHDGPIQVGKLKGGNFFGEQSLLNHEPRAATVKALSEVKVFILTRKQFETLLGPLSSILERISKERKDSIKSILETEKRALDSSIKFEDLRILRTLGTGTFGRVKLVQHKKTMKTYALKCLQKAVVVHFKQEGNVMNEKNLLLLATHPFILQLVATYKDRNCLYMLLELVQGGELFSLLHNQNDGVLPVKSAQFYSGCVVSALTFLHSKLIVYRDLKPENLLIDKEGYCKVVDFGFAKVIKDRSFTLCGTPEYLAPEIVLGSGYGRGVDYWAVGILIFEMLCGYTPFHDEDNDSLKICNNIVSITRLDWASHVHDANAKDIVTQLLVKKQSKRLGVQTGSDAIKAHPFFRSLSWDKLETKSLKAPWIPKIKGDLDASNFDPYDENDTIEPFHDTGDKWYEAF